MNTVIAVTALVCFTLIVLSVLNKPDDEEDKK